MPAKKRPDAVTAYAKDVVARKIVAGRPVVLACRRHLVDVREGKKRGLAWKPDLAQRAITFFSEILVLEDGQPFNLQPYQAFIVGCLFGWYKGEARRFRDAYVESGKGSGKTPLAAGIGLYALVADGEPAPEVYSAATTREQARISYKDATRMVEASEDLKALVEVQVGSLTIPSKNATFRPVSSEHKGLDGLRVHCAIIDELHEHPTAMVVDKIRAGTKRRRNALIFRITNSGFDRTSVCWNEHDYSIKVLEGTLVNDSWFAYVCSLDPGDKWTDEAVWPKANPGVSVGLPPYSYLRDQVAAALGMPSKENLVRRLNFCEWTEQSSRWLDIGVWNAGAQPVVPETLIGRPLWAALDASSTQDITAFVMLFGPEDGTDDRYDVLARFWIPEASLDVAEGKRTEQARLQLRQWVVEGHITATPGNEVDYDLLEAEILQAIEPYALRELAFDAWNVTQLVTHLKDHLGEERLVKFPQSFAGMSAPARALEKVLNEKRLRHGGNPVLTWMASNVALRVGPNGTVKPDKDRSADKIDGIVALVMALGRATVAPAQHGSVYEERGMVVI